MGGKAEDGKVTEAAATKAVQEARAAVDKTRRLTDDWGTWKSTLGIMRGAEKSLEQGNYEAAMEGAEEAEYQAEQGLAQYREEQDEWRKAVSAASQSGDYQESEWISRPSGTGEADGGGMEGGETRSVANGTLRVAPGGDEGVYTVGKGDTLWGIASAEAIYGDPFAWPLIYKENSDRIEDPDLIFPDQEFTVEWGVSSEAYDAAVHHAKTRGAWKLGETEDSDLEYLERN
jgi:nucleoid-associated protein YgaU